MLFEPPVTTCTKICCLALNYLAHDQESGLEMPPEPVLFFRQATTAPWSPLPAPATWSMGWSWRW
ncbi:hypothetical protein [Nonomuraea angiospora]|uniref:hypothetical protein n=1 Tax=Nonomuraea angiospora TaxID=46172 RepID=UPI0029BA5D4A|nr:hypothetical protein [Nonomuraea angiospora]MDX3104509.1 hypothetical protein [Nonomuraea angiospora]